jgi:O-antigen ligase
MVLENAKKEGGDVIFSVAEQQGVCHNIYWLTAAEQGYPGLILLVLVFCVFLRAAWNGVHLATMRGVLLTALLLGSIALHLSGLLEPVFSQSPVLYMFAITCACIVVLNPRFQPRAGSMLVTA